MQGGTPEVQVEGMRRDPGYVWKREFADFLKDCVWGERGRKT